MESPKYKSTAVQIQRLADKYSFGNNRDLLIEDLKLLVDVATTECTDHVMDGIREGFAMFWKNPKK